MILGGIPIYVYTASVIIKYVIVYKNHSANNAANN